MTSLRHLHRRVAVIATLATAPVLLAIAIEINHDRMVALDHTRDEADVIMAIARDNLAEQLTVARQLLQALASGPLLGAAAREPCHQLFSSLKRHTPMYSGFGVVDTDGVIQCSEPRAPAGMSVAGMAWFEAARRRGEFAVGEYQVGRVTGHPVLSLGLPVRDATGRTEHYLGVGLSLEWLGRHLSAIPLPPGGVLTVLDQDGRALVHLPDDGVPLGQRPADSVLVRSMLAADSGTLDRPAAGGAPLHYAFARIDPAQAGQLRVAVGLPLPGWLRPGLQSHGLSFAMMLLVTSGLVWLLWSSSDRLLIRPARAQAEAVVETNRALDRNRAMLEAIVEGTPDAIYIKDRAGRYLLANRATAAILRKSPAQILGHDDTDHLPPAAARQIMGDDREILEDGRGRSYKEQVLTPVGLRTFSTTKAPYRDSDGGIGGIVGISRDIEEEESLRLSVKTTRTELAELLEQLGEGLVGFDAAWRYTLVNASAATILKRTRDELLGRTIWEVFPEAEWGAEGELLREAMATGEPRAGDVPSVLGGWYQVRAFPSGDGLLVFFSDTTEHHRVREALQHGMEQARALFAATPLAIVGLDLSGVVLEWAGAAERIFGWPRDEAVGRPLASLFPGCEHEVDETRAGVLGGRSFTGRETIRPRRGGAPVPVSISCAPVRDARDEITGIVMTYEDITTRRKAEAWREEFTTRLRALNARIEAAREEERQRIARELHDELGAVLTALKMDVVALERGGGGSAERTTPSARLAGMREQLDQTVRSLRRIATQLRPPLLDELGLVPAIEWLVGEYVERTGILTEFHCEAEQAPLSPTQATALFRVAQEALTNIARHAEAAHAFLTLEVTAEEVRLIVEDDGRGLPEQESPSLGILGMRERAELLGGSFQIERRAAGGTRLVLTLPVGAAP